MRTCTVDGCDKAHRARGLCSTHYNRAHQPDRHVSVATQCVVCLALVTRPKRNDRRPVCSPTCRTLPWSARGGHGYIWAEDAVRRARAAGVVVVDSFTREEIFERDAWTCQICGLHLSTDTHAFDPTAPTVDHIVSLKQGGEHSKANAQTACLHCNSAKRDAIAA
jgi:hypothetical protein